MVKKNLVELLIKKTFKPSRELVKKNQKIFIISRQNFLANAQGKKQKDR